MRFLPWPRISACVGAPWKRRAGPCACGSTRPRRGVGKPRNAWQRWAPTGPSSTMPRISRTCISVWARTARVLRTAPASTAGEALSRSRQPTCCAASGPSWTWNGPRPCAPVWPSAGPSRPWLSVTRPCSRACGRPGRDWPSCSGIWRAAGPSWTPWAGRPTAWPWRRPSGPRARPAIWTRSCVSAWPTARGCAASVWPHWSVWGCGGGVSKP
ncbi:hypothetical protein DSECCO2_646250 [anaerobic digester metagenome]